MHTCVSMHMNTCKHMHVNGCPRKPEVFDSPGAEDTGGYKLPIVAEGNESQLLSKSGTFS